LAITNSASDFVTLPLTRVMVSALPGTLEIVGAMVSTI